MNYYLYADNFRGFRDTHIPVADVNFLVGENSTGKSSILGLIRLLSGPSLLMREGFNGGLTGFGHFADVVSVNSADQSYFRIGFTSDAVTERRSGARHATGCLFTFHERQGQAQIYKCTLHRDGIELSLKFGRSAYYYKTREIAELATAVGLLSVLRDNWVGEHSSDKADGYIKLDAPPGIPLLFALAVALEASKSRQKAKSVSIALPEGLVFTPPPLTWFGPIRTKPKRTYDELSLSFSSEGRHTPYLIRRMLKSRAHAAKLRQFIETTGKSSGLFQGVSIKNFGGGPTPRFELDIILDGKALNILNVGYGVSQALPIMVELLARDKGTWFAIQEPEIHLHPRAQAAFGDVLFDMALLDRKRFLVETHSDYTIDRFRMRYRNGRSSKPEGQILFFERLDRHNVVTPLPISMAGELPANQPESYRQFFIREQMSMLGI